MPLFTGTQQQYYTNTQQFTGDGTATAFTLTFSPLPQTTGEFNVFFDGIQINNTEYDATPYSSGVLTFDSAPAIGVVILIKQIAFEENLGNYQFIQLDDIINNFIISYVGEDKVIPKVKRTNIAFHAQRALQEMSYDTFKTIKSQEIELPPSLTMALPHDYVNYVKIAWKDSAGLEHIMYPINKTSNPTAILQDSNFEYIFDGSGNAMVSNNSNTWDSFRTNAQSDVADASQNIYDHLTDSGRRYGIEPSKAQTNGNFYIDEQRGKINFSSDVAGKIIIVKYISDSLGTDKEMMVHKFAEEALYKWLAHAILSTKANVPEHLVMRFKKERFAAVRTAKLRLSNLKMEELAQLMRGKAKQIKH
tara:strand:+ start:693 stop:1778 length:1086 start_codon:yes stop_codon:yes gene_type:complete